MNELFNKLASRELDDTVKNECWSEICQFLYLGSTPEVLKHIAEARANIRADLLGTPNAADRAFLEWSAALVENLVVRIASLSDYSVRRAGQLSGLFEGLEKIRKK